MEKAKHQPDNPKISGCWRPVIELILGLAFILLACILVFGIFVSINLLDIYNRVSSVRDWDVPPETEVIDFETSGFYSLCFDEGCSYYARLYLVSNHSKSYLEDFYREHYGNSINPHLWVSVDDNLHNGRPVYSVYVRWFH